MTHAANILTIDPTQKWKQENEKLRKDQKNYLAELGVLKQDVDEMKQLFGHLSKESQKQLINEFNQKVDLSYHFLIQYCQEGPANRIGCKPEQQNDF